MRWLIELHLLVKATASCQLAQLSPRAGKKNQLATSTTKMSLLVATYRNSVSTFPVLGVDLYLQYNFKYSNPGISQKGNWYIFQKQLNPAAPDITWSFFWSFHTSFPIHLSRFFPLYFYLFIYFLLSFLLHFLLLDLYNFISYSSVFCSPFNFCSHCFSFLPPFLVAASSFLLCSCSHFTHN